MWQTRKLLKKTLRQQLPELDEFKIESQVTQRMMTKQVPGVDSVLEFYVTFTKEHGDSFTLVRINMYPTVGSKEFTCFFAFFSSFVAKIVEKCFVLKCPWGL